MYHETNQVGHGLGSNGVKRLTMPWDRVATSPGWSIAIYYALFSTLESQGGHGGGWNETLSRDKMSYYFQKVTILILGAKISRQISWTWHVTVGFGALVFIWITYLTSNKVSHKNYQKITVLLRDDNKMK